MEKYHIFSKPISTGLCVAGGAIVSGMAVPSVRTKVHGLFNVPEEKQVLFDVIAVNIGMALGMAGWAEKQKSKFADFVFKPSKNYPPDATGWEFIIGETHYALDILPKVVEVNNG